MRIAGSHAPGTASSVSTVLSLMSLEIYQWKDCFFQWPSSPNYNSVFSQPGAHCGWLCLTAIFVKSCSCHIFVSVPHFSFGMCYVKLAWLQFGLFSSHIDKITYNLQTIQKFICSREKSIRKSKVMNLFTRACLWFIVKKWILSFL